MTLHTTPTDETINYLHPISKFTDPSFLFFSFFELHSMENADTAALASVMSECTLHRYTGMYIVGELLVQIYQLPDNPMRENASYAFLRQTEYAISLTRIRS